MQSVEIRDRESGSQAKVLAGFGFNCYSFQVTDQGQPIELLWAEEGFETGEKRPSGSGTPILFPFPGRLPGMSFPWDGKSYPLESDGSRGNGIHGFVHNRPWRVVEQSESRVVGQFQASVDAPELLERWPADFRIQAAYEVSGQSLLCELTIDNPSEKSLPCGLGTHPYFRLPLGEGSADDCRVTIPATHQWTLKDMLPTGERASMEQPIEATPFGKLTLDNVFTGLPFDDGRHTSTIAQNDSPRQLQIAFDGLFRECVVYTPPHREAICIEPYTCCPAAANRADFDHGWRVLAPGESLQGAVEVRFRGA